MTELAFVVLGKPQPAGSKRAFRNPRTGGMIVTDANQNTKPWQALVASAALGAMVNGRQHELLRGPIVLEATFYQPRPKGHYRTKHGQPTDELKPGVPLYPTSKPDTTKLVRAVEDAMEGIVFRNDAQIVNQWARKMYGEPARCEVRVEALEDV